MATGLNTITKMRLPDGREVAFVDWSDKPLFSTCEILSGAQPQEINLFQYTVGDAVPAFAPVGVTAQRSANESDTNLAAPGAMASTEEFLVYAIKPEVCARSVADPDAPDFANPVPLATDAVFGHPFIAPQSVKTLQCALLMQLEISQKIFASAGYGYFNAGFGVDGFAFAGDPFGGGRNGMATNEAVRQFAIPQHIGGQEKFRLFLSNPSGEAITLGWFGGAPANPQEYARIRVYLDGLYKRPVS